MKKFSVTLACAMLAASAGVASAAVSFVLDDNRTLPGGGEDPTVYILGTSPYGFDPTTLNIQSGPSFPESFDLHGEYLSSLNLANGTSITVNINFTEENAPDVISDTLNMVFTGHTPTQADANNISVDLHFRSDDESGLPPLTNAFTVPEVPGQMDVGSFIHQSDGPTDFDVGVISLPAPASAAVLGIAGLTAVRRRRSA